MESSRKEGVELSFTWFEGMKEKKLMRYFSSFIHFEKIGNDDEVIVICDKRRQGGLGGYQIQFVS